MFSRVSPEARRPSRRETGNRRPRMHGFPVHTFGSTVIRSNFIVFHLRYAPHCSIQQPLTTAWPKPCPMVWAGTPAHEAEADRLLAAPRLMRVARGSQMDKIA